MLTMVINISHRNCPKNPKVPMVALVTTLAKGKAVLAEPLKCIALKTTHVEHIKSHVKTKYVIL